jgi:hydrogenase-4 component E
LPEQYIHLLASVVLLLSFAMLAQRRIRTLIHLFALQGFGTGLLDPDRRLVQRQPHLYYSAALTLVLKVIVLPLILYRLIERLQLRWDTETGLHIPATLLLGLVLVVFAFGLAQPMSQLRDQVTQSTLGIAIAVVMLAFLMMITRRKAVTQVIGFLAMENGLFFAATSATDGMPMVVELGIALDVLVGMLILGVFFFQIREQFDSLDLHHLEKLKEE